MRANMNTFFDIPGIGSLHYHYIFLDGVQPILFTCADKENNLYLCSYCEANATQHKWLVAPVEQQDIIDMLKDKITIRECFTRSKKDKYTFIFKEDKMQLIINDTTDWDYDTSPSLPVKGEYLEAEADEFTNITV